MPKQTLIIVESPTKARTLTRFLGNEYRIEASMGHIRDLPQKRLGVDINHDFEPTYTVPNDKKEIAKKLQAAAANASSIILATDPDREGEAIAWHVAYLLTKQPSNRSTKRSLDKKLAKNTSVNRFIGSSVNRLQRIVFHEITRSAIEEAIKHPRVIDQHLVDAQQGRRVLDRLVGYKLSPLLWYKTGKNWLSAGRVQSIAVRLIVEREREIGAFVPVEYWEIGALLRTSKQQTANSKQRNDFTAQLVKIGEDKAEVKNKEQADTVLGDLEKAKYRVSGVKTAEIKKRPYPPFITSTLQRAASTLFGWSARKTITIAQNLYEEGLITYHRTDSVQLSQEALSLARNYIEKKYGKDYLPETPNTYKTSAKVAQEAHEAIRPSALGNAEDKKFHQKGDLGKDHGKLLDLITKRFLASQMKEQVIERRTIEVTANPPASPDGSASGGRGSELRMTNYELRASGDKQIFPGWRAVYIGTSDSGKEEAMNPLPAVSEGDPLDLLKLLPEQKFTQPPARYNEASLIKALEEQGIGRPSTYAPTIHTIQARQYVEKNDSRAFIPTELGTMVNDFLVEQFGDIINVTFTAEMEDKLDKIADGKEPWKSVIRTFWQSFEKELLKTRQNVSKIEMPNKETGEKCPECGGALVERIGRYGKFVACSNFPKCKYTKPIVQTVGIKCPRCGGEIVLKKTKKGRKFFGCSNYPKCTFASWRKPGETPAKPANP